MRVEKAPKVYLIGRTAIVEQGFNDFLKDMELKWPTPTLGVKDAERIVEMAGRVCYMSFGSKAASKTNLKYIQNLVGRNADGTFRIGPAHGAVLEHPVWNFLVVGAGRGFSHEQVRNRAGWAYSQLSTRYCDYEGEDDDRLNGDWTPGWCVPPLAQLSESTSDKFEKKMQDSLKAYTELLHDIMNDLINNQKFMNGLAAFDERTRSRMVRKAARGAARDILINATEAIMVMSANARALWNTIALRGNEHAEGVIREVYIQIAKIMEIEMPSLFNGLEYKECWDGSMQVIMPREHI